MDYTFSENLLEAIHDLDELGIEYVIDNGNDVLDNNVPPEVLIRYPRSVKENSAHSKLYKKYNSSKNGFLFKVAPPLDMVFEKKYFDRQILNYNGIALNFAQCEAVKKNGTGDYTLLWTPDTADDGVTDYYSFSEINALNLYRVEYLVVDRYPIDEAFTNYNTKHNLVLWVNPTEENAKRVRMANKKATGNPPSLKEMQRNTRRFIQGGTYWQTYYKKYDFDEAYKNRIIVNCRGIAINVVPESVV